MIKTYRMKSNKNVFSIVFSKGGLTYNLLNTEVSAATERGLKAAITRAVNEKMNDLGRWYGHGTKLSVTATNKKTGIVAAYFSFNVL